MVSCHRHHQKDHMACPHHQNHQELLTNKPKLLLKTENTMQNLLDIMPEVVSGAG